MTTRIQLRRDTAARWSAADPVLSLGEPGFETDTGRIKLGDGVSAWSALNYSDSGGHELPVLNVKRHYAARGDGEKDDTKPIQAAIDDAAAAGGGVVYLPHGTYIVTSLTLKSRVTLTSGRTGRDYDKPQVLLQSLTSGATVIDTPDDESIYAATVEGITVSGGYKAGVGIRMRRTPGCMIRSVMVMGCRDQGIILGLLSSAVTVEDVLIVNVLMTRDRGGTPAGAIEVRGNDAYLSRVEAGCSLTSGPSSASMNAYAWLVANDANFFSCCVGEISDGGWYVSGRYNQFTACRGDLNWKEGWRFVRPDGAYSCRNMISGCQALNNGRAAGNTYSGFLVEETSGGNVFAACNSTQNGQGGGSNKYGFEDRVRTSDPTFATSFAACRGDFATSMFAS